MAPKSPRGGTCGSDVVDHVRVASGFVVAAAGGQAAKLSRRVTGFGRQAELYCSWDFG